MPYATAQDLITRLGDREATAISDRAGTGQPDLEVLSAALAGADDEVNSYVRRRYLLPLTSATTGLLVTPLTLQRLTIDIARYRQTGTEIMETEAIRNRFKDAIKVLEQISRGEISLGELVLASAGGPAAVSGNTSVRTSTKGFGDLSQVL